MWRATERLGYAAIAERLNADSDRYPVPRALDPTRQRDAWGRSTVREILVNPKYTGYMVWNRRAMKKGGKHNPPSVWVWSPEPTHEPLVTKSIFDAAAGTAERRQRSRDGASLNSHPETTRSYLLRSFVVCDACGRRMYGRFNKSRTYYVCQPALNHAGKVAERFPDHPASIWIREDPLLAAITEFFTQRILGPDRSAVLALDLGTVDHRADADRASKLDALRKSLDDNRNRQDRLIRTLETQDDPDGGVFTRVQDRLRELEVDRRTKLDALANLEGPDFEEAIPVDLLDQLPVLGADLLDAPAEQLRHLFEAFRLVVRYNKPDHRALVQVTLTDDTIDHLNTNVIPLVTREDRRLQRTSATTPRHGSAWHPQRDSNPCRHLERENKQLQLPGM
jgi:site-specific DNA recombinase